jgi:FSR family fosmidomycin resistance protein-like MFS transporter
MSANAEVSVGGVAGQRAADAAGPVRLILWTMCGAHFLNDMLQSLISAIFPLLKTTYNLDYTMVAMIALAFQVTASLFQPLIGVYTDKHPTPWALAAGMGSTLIGMVLLGTAGSYYALMFAAAMVGTGSAIFHPEGSRVVRMASGGRLGTAQSIFQVGGNFGQASGPLIAAFLIVPLGQFGVVWFAGVALLAMVVLFYVGRWYRERVRVEGKRARVAGAAIAPDFSREKVLAIVGVLLLLMFSKSFYTAAINTFYTFYLMDKFGLDLRDAQLHLFLYMASVAAGVYFGGPLGDRLGRKRIIWFSILAPLPFTLALPYANLFWSGALTVIIGFIMSSSLSQIVVYAMELRPNRTGMLTGLFLGFAFGMSGVAALALGKLIDLTSLQYVYEIVSFTPAVGVLCWFLPELKGAARARAA